MCVYVCVHMCTCTGETLELDHKGLEITITHAHTYNTIKNMSQSSSR